MRFFSPHRTLPGSLLARLTQIDYDREMAFVLFDKADDAAYRVAAIHDANGYRALRTALARQYDAGTNDPNIQVTGADLKGNRTLFLEHRMHRGVPLHDATKEAVLGHIELLWGHDVALEEVAV